MIINTSFNIILRPGLGILKTGNHSPGIAYIIMYIVQYIYYEAVRGSRLSSWPSKGYNNR